LFIRTKRDWKQTYFYLVRSYRTKEGLPRQFSIYLGTTLNLTAQQWANVLPKADDIAFDAYGEGDSVRDAVRAYCKKHGLLLKTADSVRAGRKLIRQQEDAERQRVAAEMAERARKAEERWEREDPEGARQAREWKSKLRNAFSGSDKVLEAARVLGVPQPASKEQVQEAFRKQARVSHPDADGDPAKFRAVVEARDVMLKHLGTTEFCA
jgi:hypothetical protein